MLNKEELVLGSLKNSTAALAGSIISFSAAFFLIGYSIRILGEIPAGFLMLVQTIFSFSSGIFNLGLGVALVKEISAASAKNDKERIKKAIAATSFINIVIGTALVIIFIILGNIVVRWSKITLYYSADAEISIIFYSLAFFINFGVSSYQAIFPALQRYDYANLYTSFQALLSGGIQIFVLFTLPSLTNLGIGYFIASLIQTIILFYLVNNLVKEFYIPKWDFCTLKQLFPYSSFVLFTQIGYTVRDYVDRSILTTIIGVGILPGFLVGQNVMSRIRSLISSTVHFVFPLMSFYSEKVEINKIFHMYDIMHWLVSLIGALIFSILSLFGYWILHVWIGKEFADSYTYLFQIACLQGIWATFSIIPHFLSYGFNKPANNFLEAILSGILILILSIILIPYIGVLGASLAQLFSYIITIIFIHWNLRRTIFKNISLIKVFNPMLAPCFLGIACFFFSLYMKRLINLKNLNGCLLSIFLIIVFSLLLIIYENKVNAKEKRIQTLLFTLKIVKLFLFKRLASI